MWKCEYLEWSLSVESSDKNQELKKLQELMEISFLSFLGGLAAPALLVSSGLGLAFICFVLPAWMAVAVDYGALNSCFTGPPFAT